MENEAIKAFKDALEAAINAGFDEGLTFNEMAELMNNEATEIFTPLP